MSFADWLGKTKPGLTYGLRGVSYFHLEIRGPGKDLHSGVFGIPRFGVIYVHIRIKPSSIDNAHASKVAPFTSL